MKLAWPRLEGPQQQAKHHSLFSCTPCSLAKQCQSKCRIDRWPSAYLVCRTVPVIAIMTNKRLVRKIGKFDFLWLMVTSEGVTWLRLAFGRACPHNGNWETIWHLRSSRLRRPPQKFPRSLVVRHFDEAKQRHNFRKNVARRRQLGGGQFFGWRRRPLLERWAMKKSNGGAHVLLKRCWCCGSGLLIGELRKGGNFGKSRWPWFVGK